MLYIDLVNNDDDHMSSASTKSYVDFFDLSSPTFLPLSVPPCLESPESPIVGIHHPFDVCPTLSPTNENLYPHDKDLRTTSFYSYDPIFDPLPSPTYDPVDTDIGYTSQELDEALLHLPMTPCPILDHNESAMTELRQRIDHLENRHVTETLALESMVNTLAVDVVNLTQGINQRLTQIFDILQERHELNFQIHRHTGDILANLICYPSFDMRLPSDLLGEVQKLRRRTLFG